jgi:Tfp pilus assembly protein PilV
MTREALKLCPECDGHHVAVAAEEMFMVNTGEHYCHSVKTQDADAKATCLECWWVGRNDELKSQS